MSHSSVFGRQRTVKSVTAVAALTLTAMLGASLETAVAQPVGAQVTAAAVVQSAQVTIGTATHALAGTNVARDVDALVVYKAPVVTTTTNMWGVEVTVVGGKVTAVNDRERTRSATGTRVPTGGAVLSGHGQSAEWLRTHAKVGAAVSLPGETTPAPAPAPVPSTTMPVAGQSVTLGTASRTVSGVNVDREVNALVAYVAPTKLTTTNIWGVEVTVVGGKVTAVNDRERTRSATGTAVPTNGYVLSGHGQSAEWLRTAAKVGVSVTLPSAPAPQPQPQPQPQPEPQPQPQPVVAAPQAGQSVTLGTASRTVSGVNVDREVNALVAYVAPTKLTTTNIWGVEVTVVGGKVTAVNDRERTRSATGTTVPSNGYVLSGHGQSAEWLRTAAKVGVGVAVSNAPVTPAPQPQPNPNPSTPGEVTPAPVGTEAPMGLPSKVRAVYHMMWSTSGSPKLSNTAAGINVVNLSFLQGDKPRIVGWGSQTEASFIADAKALRSKGVRIVASVGGAHGNVNVRNREAFVQGVMELNAKIPLDGLDWDIEGSTPMPAADVVWISKRLKELRGQKFAITLAPNGSNIDAYRAIAVQLQQQGALDMIGQQFYDAVVSKEAALGRVRQLVQAGIPQEKVSIGMMVGSQDVYWTIDECLAAVKLITASYPNIRGGYLWEAGRAGTADWASKMTALFPGA